MDVSRSFLNIFHRDKHKRNMQDKTEIPNFVHNDNITESF